MLSVSMASGQHYGLQLLQLPRFTFSPLALSVCLCVFLLSLSLARKSLQLHLELMRDERMNQQQQQIDDAATI